MLPRNVGPVDRTIRLVAGALLLAVGLWLWDGLQRSTGGVVAAAFGAWFMLTGAVGFCPLYVPFGINTCGSTQRPKGALR
jgi:hypothetical protein